MELSQYFTALVLGTCVTHLLWTASAHISAWRDVRKNSRSQKTSVNAEPIQERGDWYVFFSCADLLGPDRVKKSTASVKEIRPQTPRKNPRPLARPSA
jgi:hypothetical protein